MACPSTTRSWDRALPHLEAELPPDPELPASRTVHHVLRLSRPRSAVLRTWGFRQHFLGLSHQHPPPTPRMHEASVTAGGSEASRWGGIRPWCPRVRSAGEPESRPQLPTRCPVLPSSCIVRASAILQVRPRVPDPPGGWHRGTAARGKTPRVVSSGGILQEGARGQGGQEGFLEEGAPTGLETRVSGKRGQAAGTWAAGAMGGDRWWGQQRGSCGGPRLPGAGPGRGRSPSSQAPGRNECSRPSIHVFNYRIQSALSTTCFT